MALKKHLGRAGNGSSPFCNGGSSALARAGLDMAEFGALPLGDRCSRCQSEFSRRAVVPRAGRSRSAEVSA